MLSSDPFSEKAPHTLTSPSIMMMLWWSFCGQKELLEFSFILSIKTVTISSLTWICYFNGKVRSVSSDILYALRMEPQRRIGGSAHDLYNIFLFSSHMGDWQRNKNVNHITVDSSQSLAVALWEMNLLMCFSSFSFFLSYQNCDFPSFTALFKTVFQQSQL